MKRQIRLGVFETNSSTTHAVTILTQEEYDKYKAGKTRVSRNGEFYDEEAYDKYLEDEKNEACKRYERSEWLKKYYPTFEEYWEKNTLNSIRYVFDERHMDIEHVEREVDGVKVHALSIYGCES